MKYISTIISITTAFILGTSVGWILKGKHVDYLFSNYVPAIVTLLAAYFSAKCAFDFHIEPRPKPLFIQIRVVKLLCDCISI